MLVLTRRSEESLLIHLPNSSETIVLKVLSVDGDKVKLGIEAPRWVIVLRQEVYDAVQQENLAARLSDENQEVTLKELGKLLHK